MILTLDELEGRYTVDTETHVVDVDLLLKMATVHDIAAEGEGVHTEPWSFVFDQVACHAGAELAFDAPAFDPPAVKFGLVLGVTLAAPVLYYPAPSLAAT